jgi:very-short-patch-repair endonuclease
VYCVHDIFAVHLNGGSPFPTPLGEGQGGVLVHNSNVPIKNILPGQNINPEKLQRASELQREMTPSEKVLWQDLRGKKLGSHFRRQQVVEGFIVDFYCHSASLIIELDGDIHKKQQEYNDGRDKILENLVLRVLRYTNDEVLLGLPRVLIQISELLGNK